MLRAVVLWRGRIDPITSDLYYASETAGLPAAAVRASLGCGNPTALAQLSAGETVLDLGSGGGIDVLLSARRVGPTGKAYGLDMTDEMLALARENQREGGGDERRVPQGRASSTSRSRTLGRRHHLELRHQSVGRQGPRARRGVPRAQARRALRGVRRRRARRGSGRTCGRTWSCGSAASRARSTRRTIARSCRGGLHGRRDRPHPHLHVEDAGDFLLDVGASRGPHRAGGGWQVHERVRAGDEAGGVGAT